MAKRTRVPKNNDVVTVYHRSYSPDSPHVGAGGRMSPTRDLHLMTEVAEEDRQHGLIGNADMSELAKTSLEEGIYSGLESDKWESTEGNRLRDNRGYYLGRPGTKVSMAQRSSLREGAGLYPLLSSWTGRTPIGTKSQITQYLKRFGAMTTLVCLM